MQTRDLRDTSDQSKSIGWYAKYNNFRPIKSPISKQDSESEFDRGFNIFSKDQSRFMDSTS